MTKPLVRQHAEMFALGWEKGNQHGLKTAGRYASMLEYSRRRVKELARWRKYAIARLAIGKQLVAEIDAESRK